MKPYADANALSKCDSCGKIVEAGALDHIDDPSERLAAGEIVPAGQCPVCTACSFLIDGSRIEHFGRLVLHHLENTDEWSSDTFADIAGFAVDCGCADERAAVFTLTEEGRK